VSRKRPRTPVNRARLEGSGIAAGTAAPKTGSAKTRLPDLAMTTETNGFEGMTVSSGFVKLKLKRSPEAVVDNVMPAGLPPIIVSNVSGFTVIRVEQVGPEQDAVMSAGLGAIPVKVKLPLKSTVSGPNVPDAFESTQVIGVALAGNDTAAIKRTAADAAMHNWIFISASPYLAVSGRPNDPCYRLRLAF
jgi:hypothetical protein